MNMVQYVIADRRLNMSPGKLAAQVAHASQLGLLTHCDASKGRTNPYDDSKVNLWLRGGHYAKVVLETADDLRTVERYLNDRGFKTALVIDEGRTEFGGGLTPTAIGTGIVDKDWPHTRETFGNFKLYGTASQFLIDNPSFEESTEGWTGSKSDFVAEPGRWQRFKNRIDSAPEYDEIPELSVGDYGYP